MLIKLVPFFILLLPTLSALATPDANPLLDSLKRTLSSTREDTHRVKILNALSSAYRNTDPEQGIAYGTRGLELARRLHWNAGMAKAYYNRGGNYLNAAKLPEALDDCLQAVRLFEQCKDYTYMAGAYSNIGGIYFYQGKSNLALNYYEKALNMERRTDPGSTFEVAISGNMGIMYFERKEYPKALNYLHRAVGLSDSAGRTEELPNPYSILAEIHLQLMQYDSVFVYIDKTMALARPYHNDMVLASALRIQGQALLDMVRSGSAQKIRGTAGQGSTVLLQKSRQSLDSAALLYRSLSGTNLLAETYKSLADLEEYRGNLKEALFFHKKYKQIGDSIYSDENKEKMLQTSMQYEYDKKQALAEAVHEAELHRQKVIRNGISAGLALLLLFSGIVYRQRNRVRKEKLRAEAERKKSDALLLNILPEEVADELKENGHAEARLFDHVTVMFTDFKGFTQISEKLTPSELVAEIHTCFKAFDHIISTYNIEKIKTIGDAYMCAGGLPVSNTTNALDVLQAAIDIQEFMQQHALERKAAGNELFEIRIGIHSGPVVAGIVGVKKFAYDIWGDTVNIASRMESSGEAGKINISGSTYELVKDNFICTYRGKIQAKNKGEIDMYFVEGKLNH